MNTLFWKVWGMPIVLGILSGIGLVAALTGDGFYDLLSWLTLGFPVILTSWYLLKTKKQVPARRSK